MNDKYDITSNDFKMYIFGLNYLNGYGNVMKVGVMLTFILN